MTFELTPVGVMRSPRNGRADDFGGAATRQPQWAGELTRDYFKD